MRFFFSLPLQSNGNIHKRMWNAKQQCKALTSDGRPKKGKTRGESGENESNRAEAARSRRNSKRQSEKSSEKVRDVSSEVEAERARRRPWNLAEIREKVGQRRQRLCSNQPGQTRFELFQGHFNDELSGRMVKRIRQKFSETSKVISYFMK